MWILIKSTGVAFKKVVPVYIKSQLLNYKEKNIENLFFISLSMYIFLAPKAGVKLNHQVCLYSKMKSVLTKATRLNRCPHSKYPANVKAFNFLRNSRKLC